MSDMQQAQLEPWQVQVLNGDHGIRAQAELIVELEDEGYEVSFEEDAPEQNPDEEWVRGMVAQQKQLEREIRRPLTSKELERIAGATGPSREVPNFVEKYGEEFKNRHKTSDGRHDLMVEELEDAKATQAQDEAEPDLDNPEPEGSEE